MRALLSEICTYAKEPAVHPGPVAVSEPVLAAMAKPLINHRGPEYARLLHRIADRMKPIFATNGDVLLMERRERAASKPR